MNDLRTLLHANVPAADAPAPSLLVEGDLARGRTALRRHNNRRGTRTALVAVAAAGVIAFAAQGGLPGGATTTATRATAPAATATLATSLVAYAGAQPDGFTIDKVPAGWTVQDSGEDQLLLAPQGATSTDTNSFAGKIIIYLTGQAAGVEPAEVSVGGTTVSIFTMLDTDAEGDAVLGASKTLYVEQPSGGYLAAQIWDATSWTNQQIAEFGAGLHVTGQPATTVG